MGQVLGSQKPPAKKETEPEYMSTLEGHLDQIASDFILRQNFQDMKSLMEKDKCDELIVLTTELISKYFKGMDVTYLQDRFSEGSPSKALETGAVKFIRKKTMDVELKKESDEKLYVCIGIAKFYVQVAHLFAAITMTVNPRYTYSVGATSITQVSSVRTDTAALGEQVTSSVPYQEYRRYQEQQIPNSVVSGNTRTVGWEDKDKIPKGSKITTSFQGICDKRIQLLKNNNEYPLDKKDSVVTINPQICEITPVQNLYQEPGIPELESLYRDKYDLSSGRFTGMTDAMKAKYQADLKLFYTAFTGEQVVPDTITRFQDVPVMQYQDRVGCLKKSAQFDFGFEFRGGNVKMGDNGDIMFFGKEGTDTGEILNDATGYTQPFKVVRMSGVGKPGYRISLWGEKVKQNNGTYYEPTVTFVNGFSGMYRNPQRGSLQDKLFLKYAEKLKNMMNKTKQNKETLLGILEQLFEKSKDAGSSVPVVQINRGINSAKLKEITAVARETIVSMYLSCERDFVDLLNVFDAIIDRQILAEAQSTQEELKQMTYRYQSNIEDIEDQAATKIQARTRGAIARRTADADEGSVLSDLSDVTDPDEVLSASEEPAPPSHSDSGSEETSAAATGTSVMSDPGSPAVAMSLDEGSDMPQSPDGESSARPSLASSENPGTRSLRVRTDLKDALSPSSGVGSVSVGSVSPQAMSWDRPPVSPQVTNLGKRTREMET
jgi:hypothetical protein